MKHPAEKKDFYRTAAAAAVAAAIAVLSSPVWAESGTTTVTSVTSSIPGSGEETPASLAVTGAGTMSTSKSFSTGTFDGTLSGTPGVYLSGDGQTIAIRASDSVTIGGSGTSIGSDFSGSVLIASSSSLKLSGGLGEEAEVEETGGLPFSSVTGAPNGGSIDIESGVKGGAGGTITLGEGYALIANASDASNPLTFTVNGDRNAVKTSVATSVAAFGPKSEADIYLTGSGSSFTGDAFASQGGKVVLNAVGAGIDKAGNPATVLSGIVSAVSGGSAAVTASDTFDQSGYRVRKGGSVTVNLTGHSVQGTGGAVALIQGEGSSFTETTDENVTVNGTFSGLGGSHSQITLGGDLNGSVSLTSAVIDYGTVKSGNSYIPAMAYAALAADMSLTVNGTWEGAAVVSFLPTEVLENPVYGLTGLTPAAGKLSVTANGTWKGDATASGQKTELTVTIGEKKEGEAAYPASWTGNATLSDQSAGAVTVNGGWTGNAAVSDQSSLTVNIGKTGEWQHSAGNPALSESSGLIAAAAEGLSDLSSLQDPTAVSVTGNSSLTFTADGRLTGSVAAENAKVTGTVNGQWNGALYGAAGSDSGVTVSSGGVWENSFKASPDAAHAAAGAVMRVTDNGTVRGTAFAEGEGIRWNSRWEMAASGKSNDLLTGTPGVLFAADQASLNLTVDTGGTLKGDALFKNAAAATVTSDGTWVGSAVADGTALTIKDGGSWTGNVWAKNGGTASVTITGTWTGMVKDPGLEPPKSYVLREEAAAQSEEKEPTDDPQITAFLAVSDLNSGSEPAAALSGITIPITLKGPDSVWNVTESGTVGSVDLNEGTMNFPTPASADAFKGTTVTVDGDFKANGGTIVMNAALGSDDSETDLLKITGDASGKAYVRVNNVGGKGALTTDGIKVIDVEGESTAVFETAGTVRGGAYVYDLGEGTDGNWYLSSLYSPEPEPEPEPAPEPDIRKHKVRPEAAAYATNLYAANTLFSMRMSDRMGESAYTEDLKDTSKNAHGVWIRTEGGHTRHEMTDTQTTTRGDWGLVQVGGDIAAWPASGAHRYHVGLMAGYAHETSKTGSSAVDYKAKGKVNGYSVGLYGTWMNSDPTGTGPYVDTWLMYQRFKNTVESSDLEVEESYHTKSFTASLEAGYTFGLKDWKGSNGFENATRLRLEGQVIRMGVRGGDHLESTGTLIQGTGAGNVRTRVGLTAYHLFENSTTGTAVKPYVSLNWFHDTKSFGSVMDGVTDKITGSRNFGEVKLGVEGKVTKNVNLWGAAGYQMGSHGLRNVEALVGAKILF